MKLLPTKGTKTMSLNSFCKQSILAVVGDEPMNLAEVTAALSPLVPEELRDYAFHVFGEGESNIGLSRLQTNIRVLLAGLANPDSYQGGQPLIRVAKGLYKRNPDQFSEEDAQVSDTTLAVELDEVKLEEGASGCVYAFTYPAYKERGWLKIGRAENLEARMKQHQAAAKNAAMPELPFVVDSWNTADPIDLERAVHGILKLRKRHIDEGAGKEWFKTTTEEILAIINFAKSS